MAYSAYFFLSPHQLWLSLFFRIVPVGVGVGIGVSVGVGVGVG